MARIMIITVLLFLLQGCTTTKYTMQPLPTPPNTSRPVLLTTTITPTTPEGDVVKIYHATIEQLIDYSVGLEKIVDKYRKLATETQK